MASFLDQLFILIINRILILLPSGCLILCSLLYIFFYNLLSMSCMVLYMLGDGLCWCLLRHLAQSAHKLPTSQLLLPLLALSQIFVLSGLPSLQQPHVTLFTLQMCEHADCVTVPIRESQ